ncbi:MAG: MarR family EPS-associated transcriptional regulator [Longimicrobiales bacterium]
MDESTHYRILKHIQDNPRITQRELARKTGFSLGKVNYCLHALMDKGLVKASNFRNAKNRMAYAYKLTPRGIEEKIRVTGRFLKIKIKEYEELKAEIEALQKDTQSAGHEADF